MWRPWQAALLILLFLILIVLALAGVVLAFSQYGRYHLQSRADSQAPSMEGATISQEQAEEENIPWKEGYVRYEGDIYDYNSDIMTFLFMGIDKRDSVVQRQEEGVNGGQADALFLLVLNPHDQTISVIGLNRNTMTDIEVYDEDGNYLATREAQLAVQHGFGDGMEESCELQEKAVRKLMYDLPIHGYCAINVSAVPTINDAVGGVDVTVLEDMTQWDYRFTEGAQLHLEGEMAYTYIQRRDTGEFASADNRLARQKQYLQAFLQKAIAHVKEDPTSVTDLYNAISPAMVTDITLDEVLYLAGTAAGYRFGEDSFYMLPGETVMGENGYEEFHVDEDGLYELIINVFYEKVENGESE